MRFSSGDFGCDVPPKADAEIQRPRRGRAVLGTMLVAIIASIVIAIVLAIVSALGEWRLALLQAGPIPVAVAVRPSARSTPGLLVPAPLAERPVRPEFSGPSGGFELAPNIAAVAPPPPDAQPSLEAAAALPPNFPPPTPRQVQQMAAGLPFTRTHDAFLWRPYVDPNPKGLERPVATQQLSAIRQESRFSPEAIHFLAAQQRPSQTLSQLRAQAAMNRPVPTTPPS